MRFLLQRLRKIVVILWALPYTLLGMLIGACGLFTGGGLHFRSGAMEFYGGAATWLIQALPGKRSFVAMTLGHVILGRDQAILVKVRAHEQVHVRQYECWGILFGPAYLGCSAWLWLKGKDIYRENPFEKQAYALSDPFNSES